MKKDSTTTIRLEAAKLNGFKDLVKKNSVSMNRAFEVFVEKSLESGSLNSLFPDQPRTREAQLSLDQRGQVLAMAVAQELQRNIEWAKKAIVKGLVGGGADIFGFRTDHHAKEKDFLADQFQKWLIKRVAALSKSTRVCILVDAGTTLWWCMRALATAFESFLTISEELRPVIVTNNIPGMEAYLAHYRSSHALQTPVECRTLPGALASGYASIVGAEAQAALKKLKETDMPKAHFIGLVGGNWNRVMSGSYPIPLASSPAHRAIKDTFIQVCDEVYIVTCLAKIFVNAESKDVNELLKSAGLGRPTNEDKPTYEDVPIQQAKASALRLVTTARPGERLLSQHSAAVLSALRVTGDEDLDNFAESSDLSAIPHLLWLFDPGNDRAQERLEEFPYLNDQHPDGTRKFLNHFRVTVL